MARKNKLIPFWMMPASWGLSGKSRLKAKAEYELTGIDLKKELRFIECETVEERAIAEVEVEFEEGKIDELERGRRIAMVTKEPWVEVKKMQVNEDDPKQGYMELDWNDEFVQMLMRKGYSGESDEAVVNKWFNDVCRTVLLQELNDTDFGLESTDAPDDVIKIRNADAKEIDDGTVNRKK